MTSASCASVHGWRWTSVISDPLDGLSKQSPTCKLVTSPLMRSQPKVNAATKNNAKPSAHRSRRRKLLFMRAELYGPSDRITESLRGKPVGPKSPYVALYDPRIGGLLWTAGPGQESEVK